MTIFEFLSFYKSKTQSVTKLTNSNWDKTQNSNCDNSKNQFVTKLKNTKCDITQKGAMFCWNQMLKEILNKQTLSAYVPKDVRLILNSQSEINMTM